MVATIGLVIVGFFTWWSLRECKISRSDFQARLNTFGINFTVPEANLRSAFLQAVREVAAENHKRFMIRKIYKHSDEYCFGLVDEKIDTAIKHLGYNHAATMTFNPETGALNCNMPHAAFDAIMVKYNEYKDVLNSDNVREMIMDIFKSWHTTSVRDRGGIYFIPVAFEAELEKLEQLIKGLPGDCVLEVAPQVDTDKTKKAIYRAFNESMKSKIADFKKELETSDDSTRESTWKKRLEEFKALQEEISFYADAMRFNGENLSEELNNLSKAVQTKLLA